MPRFTCSVSIEADDAESAALALNTVAGVDSVYGIEEDEELPEGDEDDDDVT